MGLFWTLLLAFTALAFIKPTAALLEPCKFLVITSKAKRFNGIYQNASAGRVGMEDEWFNSFYLRQDKGAVLYSVGARRKRHLRAEGDGNRHLWPCKTNDWLLATLDRDTWIMFMEGSLGTRDCAESPDEIDSGWTPAVSSSDNDEPPLPNDDVVIVCYSEFPSQDAAVLAPAAAASPASPEGEEEQSLQALADPALEEVEP